MSNAYPPSGNHPEHGQPPAGPDVDPQPGPDGAAPRKRRTGMIAAIAVVGLVTVGGVGAAVGMRMLGGGGQQPDEVLPKSSLVYARLDLDPSAGQKVSAYRLLDKFPAAKDVATAQDPKKALFEQLQKNDPDGSLKDVDYARDVEPWLGDRVGISVLAPETSGGDPVAAVAVQVKDQAKAEEGYAKLRETAKNARTSLPSLGASDPLAALSSGTLPGNTPQRSATAESTENEDVHWFKDDYLIITDKKHEQTVRSAMDAGNLRSNGDFEGDMRALGDQGVASMWVDGPRFLDVLPQQPETQNMMRDLKDYQGRSASTVRFSSDYLEVASVGRGAAKRLSSQDALRDVTSLPDRTTAVMSVAGGGAMLQELWPMIQDTLNASNRGRDPLADVEAQSGLRFPDDLVTLLGSQFDVVVPEQDFASGATPEVGARLTTDRGKAEDILTKLQGLGLTVPNASCGDRLCLGTTNTVASRLGEGGSLGNDDAFRNSVADADRAGSLVYVNLDHLESLYLDQVPADQREAVQALRAVGMSSYRDGDVDRSTMRLLAN